MRLHHLLPFLLISIASAADSDLQPVTLKVGDVDRTALLFVPAPAPTEPTPVIFAFHGHGGSSASAARSFGFHKAWPQAIVVYPQGLLTPGMLTDPEGKKPGWQNAPGIQKDRDLFFFDAMLAMLKKDYHADPDRIYSTGHSNGGGFTYCLWAARADQLAAIAPCAAAARSLSNQKFTPLPVMHIAGEKDPLVIFDWQKRTMEAVKQNNNCEPDGKPWATEGKLVGTIYASKSGGAPVVTVIHPGTHAYPPEAPKLIVKFFQEHTRKPAVPAPATAPASN